MLNVDGIGEVMIHPAGGHHPLIETEEVVPRLARHLGLADHGPQPLLPGGINHILQVVVAAALADDQVVVLAVLLGQALNVLHTVLGLVQLLVEADDLPALRVAGHGVEQLLRLGADGLAAQVAPEDGGPAAVAVLPLVQLLLKTIALLAKFGNLALQMIVVDCAFLVLVQLRPVAIALLDNFGQLTFQSVVLELETGLIRGVFRKRIGAGTLGGATLVIAAAHHS
mmetsp:Transcript_17770/g.41969  ORF Transcript_17770/g.41969 Transcript_17770/m.41969 type:complete len:226 (-) Transcript_17770:17-694(-)